MEAAARARFDLIDQAKAGDKEAYEALLRPALPAALRLARTLLGGAAEAEDAVQEAAIKGWRRVGNLRERTDFEPWFLGIVVRQARTLQRGSWWRVVRMPVLSPTAGQGAGAWLEGEDLRRAVTRLPRSQREAVVLHFYLDLTIEGSAQALGLSAAAIKSRLNRALRQLRSEF